MTDAPAPLPTRSQAWLLVPVSGFAIVSLLAGFLANAELDAAAVTSTSSSRTPST